MCFAPLHQALANENSDIQSQRRYEVYNGISLYEIGLITGPVLKLKKAWRYKNPVFLRLTP